MVTNLPEKLDGIFWNNTGKGGTTGKVTGVRRVYASDELANHLLETEEGLIPSQRSLTQPFGRYSHPYSQSKFANPCKLEDAVPFRIELRIHE